MDSERFEDFVYEAAEEDQSVARKKLKFRPRGGRGSNPTVAAIRSERMAIELDREVERHRRVEEYAS